MVTSTSATRWVLLSYRVPRQPSTPRIAIWRRLKRLGVAQIVDGLVALPADARTVEALEWVADDVVTAGGTALVWRAELMGRSAEREVITGLAAARAVEYVAVTDRARAALQAGARQTVPEALHRLRLLRRELRQIQRRDFFPPPEQQEARTALREFADYAQARRASEAADHAGVAP